MLAEPNIAEDKDVQWTHIRHTHNAESLVRTPILIEPTANANFWHRVESSTAIVESANESYNKTGEKHNSHASEPGVLPRIRGHIYDSLGSKPRRRGVWSAELCDKFHRDVCHWRRFGIERPIIREIARDRSLAGKFLGNVVTLKLLLLVVIAGLMVGAMIFLGYPQQTTDVVYIFVIYTVFQTFITLFYSMFQAFEKMEYQAVAVTVNGILMFVGVVAGLTQHFDVAGFAFIYLAVNIIVFVISLVFCTSKCAVPRPNIEWAFWTTLLKEALPFGLSAAFIVTYM